MPPDEWPELRIALHPSVALLKSDFPVVSIWRANLYANDNTLEVWRPECALIVRPHLQVDVHIVSAGVSRVHRGSGGRPDRRRGDRQGVRRGPGF